MVDFIYNHPKLKQHKRMFISKLSRTIKCDFSDRESTEQDYKICLWKAVVMLFYHRKYSFYCKACKATDYIGKNGKTNKIDRLFEECPSCGAQHDPEVIGKSPIGYTIGDRYCQDPHKIIDDEKQLTSYFGEWINNAITQQLFENNPATTRKEVTVIATYLEVVKSKMIDLLKRNKVAIDVDENNIKFPVLSHSPTFINSLVNIVPDARQHGVEIVVMDTGIRLIEKDNCKTVKFKKPVHELVKLEHPSQDPETTTVIYDKPITDVEKVDYVDAEDFALKKFDSTSAAIYQICRHSGVAYNRYTFLYGDKVTWSNIKEMYGLSNKQLKRRRNDIKAVLEYYLVST